MAAYVQLGAGQVISLGNPTDLPARNILHLPFRRTHSLSLSDAIKQYISTKYDQHPDMFTQDLEAIDRMRTDAINVREPHVSGIKKITAYAAQLVWIGGKFPVDVSDSRRLSMRRLIASLGLVDWRRLHLVSCPGIQRRNPWFVSNGRPGMDFLMRC